MKSYGSIDRFEGQTTFEIHGDGLVSITHENAFFIDKDGRRKLIVPFDHVKAFIADWCRDMRKRAVDEAADDDVLFDQYTVDAT